MSEVKAAIALTQVYVWLLRTPQGDRGPRHEALCDTINDALASLTGNAPHWVREYHEAIAGAEP